MICFQLVDCKQKRFWGSNESNVTETRIKNFAEFDVRIVQDRCMFVGE